MTIPKPKLYPQKSLLCVWWNMNDTVHYELLEYQRTITIDIYCQQFGWIKELLYWKCPALVKRKCYSPAWQYKIKLCKTNQRKKKRSLRCEILPHPQYLPDIASIDFHLFELLNHFIGGRTFRNKKNWKRFKIGGWFL